MSERLDVEDKLCMIKDLADAVISTSNMALMATEFEREITFKGLSAVGEMILKEADEAIGILFNKGEE